MAFVLVRTAKRGAVGRILETNAQVIMGSKTAEIYTGQPRKKNLRDCSPRKKKPLERVFSGPFAKMGRREFGGVHFSSGPPAL